MSFKFDITRTINNEERIKGIATFEPTAESNVMIYKETGTRRSGLQFCRTNIYKFYPGRIKIYMVGEDSPMHDLVFVFNDGKFQAKHVYKCGKDIYNCRFEILNNSEFEMHYKVMEPTRQYTISTTYKYCC